MKIKASFKRVLFLTVALLTIAAAKSRAETIYVYDSDNNGIENVVLIGSNSYDSDGSLIDWQWKVNTVVISTGYGPTVPDFAHDYAVGISTTILVVRDDVQVSSAAAINIDVLPAGSNQPPVADGTVPSIVFEWSVGHASVPVDATSSHDAENDPIIRYVWTEGTTTFYDGANPINVLAMSGLGNHTLKLTVYSKDNLGIIQSGFKNFAVEERQFNGGKLAGWNFDRTRGQDFSFDPPNDSFAAIAFNPLTQTYYVTDNSHDQLFEIQQDGSLIRTVDISGLKRSGIATTDAEGIAWMHGYTFVIALHDGKEMAVVDINPSTTALNRGQATIYDVSSGPGKPKGVAYAGWENSFYWVTKDAPKQVIKSKINGSGQWTEIWRKDVDSLPVADLADVAVFPRLLSPGNTTPDRVFLLSESSKTVMEVDLAGATAVLKSTFSLAGWDIPQAGGISFNQDGKMVLVGKHVPSLPEDDFMEFTATGTIPNSRPTPKLKGAS